MILFDLSRLAERGFGAGGRGLGAGLAAFEGVVAFLDLRGAFLGALVTVFFFAGFLLKKFDSIVTICSHCSILISYYFINRINCQCETAPAISNIKI
jgi:hypothetical protein